MRTITRRAVCLAGMLAVVGLTGCPGPKPVAVTIDATPKPMDGTKPTTAPGKRFRAALVLDVGGVDDKSFNAAAWAGLQKAQKDLGLGTDDVKYVETKSASDYTPSLRTFATQGYDVVIAVGFAMEDALKQVAAESPDVKFAIIDGNIPAGATNCVSLKFKEEQGSFLVGYVAAAVSKTKKIGFVGGMQIPLIEKFEAGYRAGAKTAGFDPDKQVLAAYTGDWNNVSKGKSQANQLFGNGADIVFHAAGLAGLGVIQAAKEKGKGFYAIGVDLDQDGEAPGSVLTSMVKHLDTAVYDTVKKAKEGRFTPGEQLYDLKQGGVGLSEMKYTKQDVSPAIQANIKKLSAMIADGTVNPPTKLSELAAFQVPKL
jgi:basic membrane protein A